MKSYQPRVRVQLAAFVIAAVALPVVAKSATFFDDLAATNGGSETVTSSRWLAGVFTTDSSTYSSLTATLLMSQATAGTAQLDLYSDGGLQPGSFVATLTSPGSFSTSSLADATFYASGLSLSANTNYWLVLHAPAGSYNWGWTSDFTVMQGWADSSNSGSTWFGGDAFPLQYRVVGGIVPEPATIILLASGVASMFLHRRRRTAHIR